jgi:integrase
MSLLASLAGLRVSEALALRWQDVDFASGLLHVPGTKTAASKQSVPMTADLAAELRAHRNRHPGVGEALLFRTEAGKPRMRHAVANAVRVAGDRAKLNLPGRSRWRRTTSATPAPCLLPGSRFRRLRRSFATPARG